VSEDGESPEVHAVVSKIFDEMKSNGFTVPLLHLHHPASAQPAENGYFRLSRHFKWALTQVFSTPIHGGAPIAKRVIILEEDLQISSDFFEFFAAIAPLLDTDDTPLAASAWNDNGIKGMVKDNTALYRSDFFPGLGWMMPRSAWSSYFEPAQIQHTTQTGVESRADLFFKDQDSGKAILVDVTWASIGLEQVRETPRCSRRVGGAKEDQGIFKTQERGIR
jgi:hypothetical protein